MKDNQIQEHFVLHYLSFYQVALQGGFRAAADASGVSKSVISLRVKSLEEYLRIRLFQRSTRNVRLTTAGEKLFAECEKLVQQLKAVQASSVLEGPLSGRLKVSAPVDLCASWLAPLLSEFRELHPRLSIEVVATDEVLEFEKEGIDLALRVDARSHSHLFQQKLGDVPFGLFSARSSPLYAATPAERLHCVESAGVIGALPKSVSIRMGKKRVPLRPSKTLVVDSMLCAKSVLRRSGREDVVILPRFTLAQELARGEVFDLFEGVEIFSATYYLISDRKFDEDRRVKELAIFLKSRWQDL